MSINVSVGREGPPHILILLFTMSEEGDFSKLQSCAPDDEDVEEEEENDDNRVDSGEREWKVVQQLMMDLPVTDLQVDWFHVFCIIHRNMQHLKQRDSNFVQRAMLKTWEDVLARFFAIAVDLGM